MSRECRNTRIMKLKQNEIEFNMKSIRFVMLTITTMFALIAALMIVMGISVYSHYHDFSAIIESAKSGRILTPSVMSIFLGLVLLVVTSFGFFGSLKKSTCMVNFYAVLLTIILIMKLIVVILAFTMDPVKLRTYINIPVGDYVNDAEIQDEIDSLQVHLNCCGNDNYMDYDGLKFTSNHSVVDVSPTVSWTSITTTIPKTCCLSVDTDTSLCTRVRPTGCTDAVLQVIVQNANVLGVLGVSVMFIQLLGIIFALLLARCIRKFKSEKAFILWKLKEEMILARQVDEAQKKENQSVYIDHPDSSVV